MTTETGADDYVGKPYDTGYVIARGRELLARRSQSVLDDRPLVLVIDDSPTYRAELQHALEAAGYAVATAATGEHGLFVAGAHPPAAILVDGVLPGIDGATVIRRIRLDASLRGVPASS